MTGTVAFVRRTRRAVGLYGVTGATARAVKQLRQPRAEAHADPFDRQFGVDTTGVVRLETLHVRGDRRLGVRYQPSEPDAVRLALEDLPISFGDFVFVDIGSGKGRVVMVAAQMPFRRVVGVEFSEELDAVARANLAVFPAELRCGGVEFHCVDAAEFEFPEDPLVLYLYNPFLAPTMRAVMDNLTASLARHPRQVFIVLSGDQSLSPIIVEAGFQPRGNGVFLRS